MKILEWDWWENLDWELILDNKLPDSKLYNSVVSCCFEWESILLTKNYRWWELPWWHLDWDETTVEALHREIKEEIWAQVNSYKLVWYYKITSTEPRLRKGTWTYYPFPISYIPFYLCECSIVWKPEWSEVLWSKSIEIKNIESEDFVNKESVKLLLKYR